MTSAKIASGDLDGLDGMNVDALVLPLFEARVQPQLVAGYADWRLSGRLARLIRDEHFVGRSQEALLMPAMGRFGAERIFLWGLGPHAADSKPNFATLVQVMADAGARRLAVGMPAIPSTGKVSPDLLSWAEAWLVAIGQKKGSFEMVWVLDSSTTLRKSMDRLRKVAKKAGLTWEA